MAAPAAAAALLTALNVLLLLLRFSAAAANANTTGDVANATADPYVTYDASYPYDVTTVPSPTRGGTEEPPGPGLPLPEAGRLPSPPADVLSVCPCDSLQGVCDVNCCCDRECVEELPLFTHCSVSTLSVRKQLCSGEVASYSLRAGADGYSELQASVQTETNPDLFCIQSQNRVDGLSHPSPAVPSDSSFDSLFRSFSSPPITWRQGHMTSEELRPPAAYQYGDVMMTAGAGGLREGFWLPASSVTSDCVDFSPAVFLKEQSSSCSRRVVVEDDCLSLPSLRMDTYTNRQLYSGRNQDSPLVRVSLDSLLLRSLDGTVSRVEAGGEGKLLLPDLVQSAVCSNVVMKVVYVVTYSSAGQVVVAGASLLLGFLDARRRRRQEFQQEFHLTFVQEGGEEPAVPLSGNPGYVVGLPLLAARKDANGVVRSLDPSHTLSLLHGAEGQDCLGGPRRRSAVRFGLDSLSGCTLRLEDATNCSLLAQVVLEVLRGPDYPQLVAAFGNAPVDHPLDWLPIRTSSNLNPKEAAGCSLPLALHLDVQWTRLGSLINPQAQIVNIREFIQTNTTNLAALSGGGGHLSLTTSVSFSAASGPAQAGFRATPTINAKLPFDFFFPFV